LSLRLLVIGEREEYRRLVRLHLEIQWADVAIVEHALGLDTPLDAAFAAAGFDAVIIVVAPPSGVVDRLVADLLARPEFAPVVLVSLDNAPAKPKPMPGLHRLYGRKIDRERLIQVLEQASEEHKQTLAMMRANPDFDKRYRFGTSLIRGHRARSISPRANARAPWWCSRYSTRFRTCRSVSSASTAFCRNIKSSPA
jgi:hypothetical protein